MGNAWAEGTKDPSFLGPTISFPVRPQRDEDAKKNGELTIQVCTPTRRQNGIAILADFPHSMQIFIVSYQVIAPF
jgi:hypothetical protein